MASKPEPKSFSCGFEKVAFGLLQINSFNVSTEIAVLNNVIECRH